MDGQPRNISLIAILGTLGLFIAGRFFGIGPLDDVWSFSHWAYSPSWYPFAWLAGIVVVAALLVWMLRITNTNKYLSLSILLLIPMSLVACWLLRLQVFAWGGGNLRIAQLAQVEVIVLRWFEYGTLLIVTSLFKLYRSLDEPVLYAAGQAWRALSLISAAVAGLGAYWLATLLTSGLGRRLLAFVLVFFGGHALLYFGYIGVEVVIAPVVTWFAAMAIAEMRIPSGRYVPGLWAVMLIGVLLLADLLFLLPAAVYVTVIARQRRKQVSSLPSLLAAGALALVIVLVYWQAHRSLEFSRGVLFLEGKLPFSTYGLFSLEHISDWLQVLFLGAPLILAAAAITWNSRFTGSQRSLITALWWMVAGGVLAVFVLDPTFGAPIDFPRFVAFLSPAPVLLAVLLFSPADAETHPAIGSAIAAAFAFMLPLTMFVPYKFLGPAEAYTKDYLESHEPYYLTACLAFRDSYFYQRNWSEAERWEKLLPVQSSDYMNLRGTDYLAQNNEYEEALKVQYRIIAKLPYWAEPRAMVAVNQMKFGRYQLAKPQLDTCLMLEPYRLEHWINLYSYYRDIQDYPEAIRVIARAEALAPTNVNVLTDKMIISYRMQNFAVADALASTLMARDSLLPYPYLIKAFLADKNQDPRGAVTLYQKFVQLAPREPDTERVKSRIDALKIALSGR